MAITLPDARQLSDEILEALRLRALRGCELGFTESDLAAVLGVARETVSRWFSAYQAEGLDGLPGERTGRPLGSGRTLTDEQAAHIQQLIDHNSPQALGIAAPLWSRPAVRDLIKKEYGIDMTVRAVGKYLKRWGYTAKRPRRHAKDQDPEEVRRWLEEDFPGLEARARQEGAEIHFADEAGVAADKHPRYGYARKGQRATMEVPGSHIRVNVVTTVSNTGEVHFRTYGRQTMNGAQFKKFLEQLLDETDKKILLVVDRLSAHDCEEVWDWVDQHGDRIDMEFLPPHSPELNPVEYLNNDTKGNVHAAGLPNSQGELGERVQGFLDKLANFPEHVRAYFEHPCVQYAAAR
jgi:transposase